MPRKKKAVQRPDPVGSLRERQERQHLRSERDALARRVVELEDGLSALGALRADTGVTRIAPAGSPGAEAVAVLVASDWHVEEVVHGWQVNGINSFDADECARRVSRFFRHGLMLVEKERHAARIDTLVLALLGDFISGSIHDELVEGNRLLPVQAVIEAQAHVAGGIDYLLENSDLSLVVHCHSGNHGRMTRKVHVSTEAGNSLERLMYHSLAGRYAGNPRVTFHVSEGYHSYLVAFGTTLRFHHGHSVRYAGGVGGLTIPLNKAVAQWNRVRRADIDVLGHFHQFFDGGNFVVNGSLIGYNAFALSIKASPEPPVQAFFLVDRDHGKTVVCPVILDKDR